MQAVFSSILPACAVHTTCSLHIPISSVTTYLLSMVLLTFWLIHLRQYLHLFVCLMILSFDTQAYRLASAYSVIPIPKKSNNLFKKELEGLLVVTQTAKSHIAAYPYARATAPSSLACFNVLYPSMAWKCGPLRSTANFSSRFLPTEGMRPSIGVKISETNEVTTAVNAAAILQQTKHISLDLSPQFEQKPE